MLRVLGCETALQSWKEYYEKNNLYNESGQDDAPPIRRVVAISGCNVKTEVGCVFRVNTHRTSDLNNVRTRFVPDEEAELIPESHIAKTCSISRGVLYEDPETDTP